MNKAFDVSTMYQRIRDLREDRDLLQKDVAAYLKCTQVFYSNYETGKRDIPTEGVRLSDPVSGKNWNLGDTMMITIVRADVNLGKIDFEVAPESAKQ